MNEKSLFELLLNIKSQSNDLFNPWAEARSVYFLVPWDYDCHDVLLLCALVICFIYLLINCLYIVKCGSDLPIAKLI